MLTISRNYASSFQQEIIYNKSNFKPCSWCHVSGETFIINNESPQTTSDKNSPVWHFQSSCRHTAATPREEKINLCECSLNVGNKIIWTMQINWNMWWLGWLLVSDEKRYKVLSLSHFQHWSWNIIKRLDRELTDGRRIYGNRQGRDCTIYLSRFHFILGIIRISTENWKNWKSSYIISFLLICFWHEMYNKCQSPPTF